MQVRQQSILDGDQTRGGAARPANCGMVSPGLAGVAAPGPWATHTWRVSLYSHPPGRCQSACAAPTATCLPKTRATLENPEPCIRRKSVPGSKFAAFWRIFVPGSSLPLRETPTRFPHSHTHRCPRAGPLTPSKIPSRVSAANPCQARNSPPFGESSCLARICPFAKSRRDFHPPGEASPHAPTLSTMPAASGPPGDQKNRRQDRRRYQARGFSFGRVRHRLMCRLAPLCCDLLVGSSKSAKAHAMEEHAASLGAERPRGPLPLVRRQCLHGWLRHGSASPESQRRVLLYEGVQIVHHAAAP